MIRIFRPCEFGCGTKIYVDPVPFYDGLKLYIRREEAVPRIHNCPKLWTDPGCFEENEPFWPDDPPPDWDWGHYWDSDQLEEHFVGLDGDFGDCSGMEYYHARHRLKQILIESLNSVPGFAIEVNVSSPYDLPYDFQIQSSSFGQFLPLELLGMFYEMDGKLKDAIKCFELQKEVALDISVRYSSGMLDMSFCPTMASNKEIMRYANKIVELERQLFMDGLESGINEQSERELKKPQTSNQEQDQTSSQDVISKIAKFEGENLRTYAFFKIPANEMTKILKETKWSGQRKVSYCQKCKQYLKHNYCPKCKKEGGGCNIENGTVKFFKQTEGYGFIEREGKEDLHVSKSNVEGLLNKGDKVEFDVDKRPKGPIATNVKKVGGDNVSTETSGQCDECEKQTILRDQTLYDKVKVEQKKDEYEILLPDDPTEWDYLELGDKITILSPYIHKMIKDYLHAIRRHRNKLVHPKPYQKEDLEGRSKIIILYIEECKKYFEQSNIDEDIKKIEKHRNRNM